MSMRMHHLEDESLSALVDEQLLPNEADAARAHLAECDACAMRFADLSSLAMLLRDLPQLEVPRDFSIGPRPAAEPANVLRLQRLYGWTRVASTGLAAVFVALVGASVYLDSAAPSQLTSAVRIEDRQSFSTTSSPTQPPTQPPAQTLAQAPAPRPPAPAPGNQPQPPAPQPQAPAAAQPQPPAAG